MYPKSTRDDARFPFIGSRAIPRSILYTTGFTSFRQLQRFPETPVSSLEEHQFQQSHSMKAPCTTYHLEMRADSLASTEEQANFPQAPQEDASFSNRYVRGILSLLPQVEWTLRCPDSKEDWISMQWLECRLSFFSQDETMSKSPVDTIEKALGNRSSGQEGSHPLDTSRCMRISMRQKGTMPDSC